MGHNHGRDYKEWLDKKEKEEKLLRQLGVDEVTIQIQLYYSPNGRKCALFGPYLQV